MSGIFGIIDPDRSVNLDKQLNLMGQVMRHREWYMLDSWVDQDNGIGLGRIGIGIFNQAPQPVWNAEHSIAIFMAGEFYDVEKEKQVLGEGVSDEGLALHLYARDGKQFVANLEGDFVIAIWDSVRKQIILTNDRFGLYPTFVARLGKAMIFAPEVKAVLEDQRIDRSVQEDAIAEYLRFQRVLGLKTFFADVNLLPPATLITFDCASASYESSQYWRYDDITNPQSDISFDEAVEQGARLWRKAIEKRCQGGKRIGIYLSGGLDSRGLLGMAPPLPTPIHTFTYGQSNCRDVYYAAQIAAAGGALHHRHPFHNGQWIKDYFDFHMQLTEGFHPWTHMHGISMLSEVRQHVDVNLSGLGDLLWTQNNFTPPELVKARDDLSFATLYYELYTQRYNWPGITEADEHAIYLPSFYQRIAGQAYRSFIEELKPYAGLPYEQRAFAFNVPNHYNRHLHYHVIFGRSHLEYRLPYFDLDLLTFCFNLPFEIGENRRLQREIIIRELPAMAAIAADADELPISNRRRGRTMARITGKLRRGVNKYIKPIFPVRQTLYADYETWLRTDLHAWAEDILTSKQMLSRAIFRPEGMTSLLNRNKANLEPSTIGKIAPLITLEMMLRSYAD